MPSILPFDELNSFTERIQRRYLFGDGKEKLNPEDEEDIIDELFELFLLAYGTGVNVTNSVLNFDWQPTYNSVFDTVNEEVAGKTWKERTEDYFANGGSVEDIVRIAETETHRIANTAALDAAKKAGATKKTWRTMGDDKVRDTHRYLEGVTVGIDEEFITYDGDRAIAPGLFTFAENNVNCRCELIFS